MRRFLLTLLGIVAGLSVAALLVTWHTITAHPGVHLYDFVFEGSAGAAAILTLGAILVFRRPEHRVTWAFVLVALMGSTQQASGAYAVEALSGAHHSLPFGRLALAVSGIAQSWFVFAFLLLVFLFPTGRPLAGRWHYVLWVLPIIAMAGVADTLTATQELGPRVYPPLLGASTPVVIEVITWISGIVMVGGTVAHVVARFARSRGLQRQQLKWFAFTFLIGFALLFAPWSEDDLVGTILWTAVPLGILTSIALAILRYRLYEIDRIISRTVSYALVVGSLGLMVFGLVSGFAVFLPSDDPLVVAVATLAVAALFNPLRKRMQLLVDRRFNRARYDSQRVIDDFADTLRDEIDPEDVVDGWVGVVEDTVQPTTVGVWVKGSS